MSQRSRRSFFQFSAVTAGALASLLACGGGGSSSTDGTLVVRTAAQANGVNYRLSSATFQVAGAETATLSTATPQQELTPGQYTVTLETGWVLEQQMGAAFQAVADAMVTSTTANVNVVRGQIAAVGFVFTAGMVTVDFAQAAAGDDDNYD